MKDRHVIFLWGGLVAAAVVVCSIGVLKIDLTPSAESDKKVERTRTFGSGLRLSQHGLYGIDLVMIGKAHMRKLRRGPFTIGAINELVLEDIVLVLPEELWKEKADAGDRGRNEADQQQSSPASTLSRLGIDVGNLKLGSKLPRFSSLAVKNIRISRLDGTNAVPWLAAASGKAERGGLRLTSGWSVENGVSNKWGKAFLLIEPRIALRPLD